MPAARPLSLPIPRTRQDGVSLLTLALVLLLISGALTAGVAYLRAALPGREIAAAQKLALARADEAIQGFASLHHRLPCPAATPNGAEDCGRAKGYLPGVIALDAMLHTPDTLTLRYMVYRNAATGDLAGNALVVVADDSSRRLPLDRYDPTPKAKEGEPPIPAFNARNSLDMCETMRLAYAGRGTNPENFAHYKRGGAPVSVAYGLVLPGAGDRSDNGSPFDGTNADGHPEMEAPDRGHGFSYDDFVFTRDFPSLMSAFGCQPVDYAVFENRTDTIDARIEFNNDVFGQIIGGFSPSNGDWQRTTDSTRLDVSYDKKGVVSPVTASVDAVAFSFSVIEKAESQRDDVEKSADSAYTYGIISSTTGLAGNIISTVKLIDNGIKIGEAAATAAACLGLCFNQYVAIGFYVASIVSEATALGFAIANTVKTIQGTLKFKEILDRLGGDSGAADGFCDAVADGAGGMDGAVQEMEARLETMKKEMDEQKARADAALGKTEDVHNQVDSCIAQLLASEGREPLTDEAGNVVKVRDRSAEAENYQPFLLDEAKNNAMFAAIMAVETTISDLAENIESTDRDLDDTDTDREEVRKVLADAADDYRTRLAESNATLPEDQRLTDAQLDELRGKNYASGIESANKEHEALQAKRTGYAAAKMAAEAEVETLREALDTAISKLPDDLDSADFPACVTANESIAQSYAVVVHPAFVPVDPSNPASPTVIDEEKSKQRCVEELERNDGFCESSFYYDLWFDYQRQQALYEKMKEGYESFAETVGATREAAKNLSDPDACAVAGLQIQLWPIEKARAILRQADKRGGLQ